MFGRKKQDDDGFMEYQINNDFMSGEDVNWDDYLNGVDESRNKKSKKKNNVRQNRRSAESQFEYSYDEMSFDFENEIPKEKGLNINIKVFVGLFLYISLVVFGGFMTTYSKGQPQVIGVELREQRMSYNQINSHYTNMETTIEEIDKLDATLNKDAAAQSFNYAISYKKLAEIIELNVKEIEGTRYDKDYVFMKDIAIETYKNINQYLLLMSNGMSAQNADYIKQAAEYKVKYKGQFNKYTDNVNKFKKIVRLD